MKKRENSRVNGYVFGSAIYLVLLLVFIFLTDKTFAMISVPDSSSVALGFIFLIAGSAILVIAGIKTFQRFFAPAKGRSPRKKNIPGAQIILLVILSVFAVSCKKVEPGYAGIKVFMYGDQKGVEDYPIRTGRVWFNPLTQDIHVFPTFLQNVVWTKDKTEGSADDESITFNSIEGAIVNADIGLSYAIEREKVPSIFVEFRQTPEHITDVYMRSRVRDCFSRIASKMKVTDIFGEKKQELLDQVKKDLNQELGPRGFKFDMVSFVGGLRVEEGVQKSINAVIEATQRAIEAENKVRQSEAEARQKVATAEGLAKSILLEAKAQAEANIMVNRTLTPMLVQWKAYERWDGKSPSTLLGTSGFVPMLNVK